MDWLKHSWTDEDKLYEPKRRVDNRISWQRPHIIGSFRSVKLGFDVEYHSLAERLFYYLLELDKKVIRYYVQPIQIEIPQIDKQGQRKTWYHVPDVLVFRQGNVPMLYQIKNSPEEKTKTFERCNIHCYKTAEKANWGYEVIYPKEIPHNIQSNITILFGFLKKRQNYSRWLSELRDKLKYISETTILELALGFSSKVDHRAVLPIVYYLIAIGELKCDLNGVINERTTIHPGNIMLQISEYFPEENQYEAP